MIQSIQRALVGFPAVTIFATTLFAATCAGQAAEPGFTRLAAACQACHGPRGTSASDEIPNLAGQKKGYLVAQLDAFRRGDRKNALMNAMAVQLSDGDIEALATFWSRIQPHGEPDARAPATGSSALSKMTFPADFPNGFSVYETIVNPENGQVTRRHANDVALRAARRGSALPEGAVIIVATHAAGASADDGHVVSYAGMESRSGWGASIPPLLRNADWGYALFDAAGRRREGINHAPCFACHRPLAADSHVFTMRALRDFAIEHGNASSASGPDRPGR